MGNKSTKATSFRFKPDEMKRIENVSKITGLSKIDVMREALKLIELRLIYLANENQKFEIIKSNPETGKN